MRGLILATGVARQRMLVRVFAGAISQSTGHLQSDRLDRVEHPVLDNIMRVSGLQHCVLE